MAAAQQSMYVPLRTLQRFLGWDKPPETDQGAPSAEAENNGQINRVTLEFNKGVDGHEFVNRMTPLLQKIDPNVKLRLTRDTRAGNGQGTVGGRSAQLSRGDRVDARRDVHRLLGPFHGRHRAARRPTRS